MNKNKTPDLIKKLRQRLELSQVALAKELHVSFPTINRWENGKTAPPPAMFNVLRQFVFSKGNECADIIADFFPQAQAQSHEVLPDDESIHSRRNGPKLEPQADESADGDIIRVPRPGITLDVKSMESMLWQAACSIRGEKDAPKFKDYILPLVFIKRLSDVFEDEIARLVKTYGNERTALEVVEEDHSLVRSYIPESARWPVLAGRRKIAWPGGRVPKTQGEMLTNATRAIAKANESLQGVIDTVDYNETRNGEREISDTAIARLIELLNRHRLGLNDVEPDFLGRAYEYLLRKFAEGQGQSAGEFFTPREVGSLIAKILHPKQGEEVYDPCCGSGGLIIKCELDLTEREGRVAKPLKLYGQELTGATFAIARMNMVIHDMEGQIVRGNTMTNPKFREGGHLKRFDIVVTNPMWFQDNFSPEETYEKDPLDRFSSRGGFAPRQSADWAWVQHIHASLKNTGRAAVVLDSGAASRGSGSQGDNNKEKAIRKWFIEQDIIESVILLPDNLFYNTPAAGVIIILNNAKPKGRKGKVLMINAGAEFEKGRPKNYLSEEAVTKIRAAFFAGKDTERLARFVTTATIIGKNDSNLMPSRYVEHTSPLEHRNIEIICNDLSHLFKETSKLDHILKAAQNDRARAKHITEFEVTEVGRLPRNWNLETLGALFDVQQGKAMSAESRGGPALKPFLRTSNILWGRIDVASVDKMHFSEEESKRFALLPGDLMVCEGGEVGRAAVWNNELPGCLYQNHIHRLRRKSEIIEPRFAMYWLQEAFLHRNIYEGAANRTTIPNLSAGRLKEFLVPVPPLRDQTSIIHLLDSIDHRTRVAELVATRLRELFSATLHDTLSGSDSAL